MPLPVHPRIGLLDENRPVNLELWNVSLGKPLRRHRVLSRPVPSSFIDLLVPMAS